MINNSSWFKKGHIPWNKGIKISFNIKQKISNTLKGKKQSIITIKKRSILVKKSHLIKKYGFKKGKHVPHSEETKRKIGISNKGKKRNLEFRKRMSDIKKQYYINNTEKHPNIKMRIKGTISKPQMELYLLIKQKYPEAELEYPIQTKYSIRFADIAIPSLKLDIEYDGLFWHTHPELDRLRDEQLEEVGWKTLRINKNNIQIQLNNILEEAKS
jgi:very-short-patch-repair endonuclease